MTSVRPSLTSATPYFPCSCCWVVLKIIADYYHHDYYRHDYYHHDYYCHDYYHHDYSHHDYYDHGGEDDSCMPEYAAGNNAGIDAP